MPLYALGLDFGTESVRAVLVDIRTGQFGGTATAGYAHGVISRNLPTSDPGAERSAASDLSSTTLPDDYALQHPTDWLDSAASATRAALSSGGINPSEVIGIGIDFTSCTMLPTLADGTPLCLLPQFAAVPVAWPKLWKHHGAKAETDIINDIARKRNEPWLARYGGVIGLEWFFPKVLETLRAAPAVYDATQVWLEAGDWFVWQLTGGLHPATKLDALVRSTCQAGYKAMWNRQTGFPSPDYFAAVDPRMEHVVRDKIPGRLAAPGTRAGALSESAAALLGLRAGTAVSVAIIDAHAGVPGAGVAEPSTMVLVMGTSSCHMMNSRIEQLVPGIAGVVEEGILPEYFGYETGQASVGDAFAWVAKTLGRGHEELSAEAARLPPGSGGVIALDWLNGCRTPLMDGRLSGAFVGFTLNTQPAQLYRAMLEATAYGMKWIVDTLTEAGVPVRRFVASGGLPRKSPLLMQIVADVLGEKIKVAASDQSVALGAAILGCLAAGTEITGYHAISQAISAMAPQSEDQPYRPDLDRKKAYERLYPLYRALSDPTSPIAATMRQLRTL